uniref:Retrotransposon gag domain-containing protein n=1 Tax=Tanacetum cinerariifolium TaxID=118510 RepID=A0A699HVY1_TANCI|nr:hypothetical protein [Tanacetum cinerariifolium]
MAPKRTSTSAAPAMNQAAVQQLVDDSVATALEAQDTNMENTDNTNRNPEPRETPAARKPFSHSNCTEGYKVKFATGTLTEDALSWSNSYAKSIGIEQADKIIWSKLKRLLTNKYCPRTEELAALCPNMVPNTEKLMEVFIGVLPRSIEGNVTASKPQTLKETINITQRLMDQVTKHNSMQGTNDHKRKFDDSRNIDKNNYPNDCNKNNHSNNHNNNNYQDNRNNYNRNNDYHLQQNRRQETVRTYAATPTENKRVMFSPNHPTFDIKDAFSSNFPNYNSASPDYSSASPGNTPSESSNNSYGLVPIASPTLSLFHDDPYMLVMHAYDTIIPPQVSIPPPTIMPPSLMLSSIFKNSFFSRKYCHQRNEVMNNHPPLLLPYLKHFRWEKVLIRQIWNQLYRGLQSEICYGTLTEDALSWWNSYAKPIGVEQANKIVWSELKRLLANKYCLRTEVKKMEDEFYNLVVKGNDLKTYARRFQELVILCPNMVPNTEKFMEAS